MVSDENPEALPAGGSLWREPGSHQLHLGLQATCECPFLLKTFPIFNTQHWEMLPAAACEVPGPNHLSSTSSFLLRAPRKEGLAISTPRSPPMPA
jgi:hypothetical protein